MNAHVSDKLDFLHARRSVPSRQLGAPAPDAATLQRLLSAAARVPDHGRLTPFRFIRIDGDARLALGEKIAARAKQRNPDASDAELDKDRNRFAFAPLAIAVVARTVPHPKVPDIEQLLSAGAVCENLLLGAQALGFGAQWLTGWPAFDKGVHAILGLADNETVAGFIHLGTPQTERPPREPMDVSELLSDYVP